MKRIFSLILILAMLLSMVSCGNKENEEETEVLSMSEDTYGVNEDIDECLRYSENYLEYPSENEEEEPTYATLNMFDPFGVQVDKLSTLTLCKSTLADIVSAIDKANKDYVADNPFSDNPYAYYMLFYDADLNIVQDNGTAFDDEATDVYYEYNSTYLVDASVTPSISLSLFKEGIPYVTFYMTNNSLLEYSILQEADWIFNEIYISDCSEYYSEPLPNFVDELDYSNLIAKENTTMSGDISFGGAGFDWESFATFCEAIGLDENEEEISYMSKSADGDKTFYNLYIPLNIYESYFYEDESFAYTDIQIANIQATFDRSTQKCINFCIDAANNITEVEAKIIVGSESLVNVHTFKIDTTDYDAIEQKIYEWIDSQNLVSEFKYYFLNDSSDLFGEFSSFKSAYSTPVIDDTSYVCVERYETGGGYIEKEKYDSIKALELTSEERNEQLQENLITLIPVTCLYEKGTNEPFAYLTEDNELVCLNSDDSSNYSILDIQSDNSGYTKIVVFDSIGVSDLMFLLTKEYRLTNAQVASFSSLSANERLSSISEMAKQMADSAISIDTDKISYTAEYNSQDTVDLSKIVWADNGQEYTYSLETLTIDKLISLGYTIGTAKKYEENDCYCMELTNAVLNDIDLEFSSNTRTLNSVVLSSPSSMSICGVKVGDNVKELENIGDAIVHGTYYIFKNHNDTLLFKVKDNQIEKIVLIGIQEMVNWNQE